MTDRTDAADEWRQQRAVWTGAAPVPDLRLPLATVEPEQRGDRAPEATAHGASDAD